MSISKIVVLIFSLVLLCVLLWLMLKKDEGKPTENYFIITENQSKDQLFERGVVVSDDVEEVKSGANGIFVEIVENGSFVKKGQMLFKLDSSEAEGWSEDALERIETLESDKRKVHKELSVIQLEERNRKLVGESELALAKLSLEMEEMGLTSRSKRLLQTDLELSELDLLDVKESLEREQRMVGKGLSTAQDVDKLQRELIAKQARLDELNISINLQLKGAQEEVLEELRTKVEMQEFLVSKSNAVSESRIRKIKTLLNTIEERISVERKDMTISGAQIKGGEAYSPRDGIAINKGYTDWRNAGRWMPNTVGSQRYMGDVIFDVIDPRKMRIETLISELDLSLVEQGQNVDIFIPALNNKSYTGILHYIGGIGMDRRDASRLKDDVGKTGVTVYTIIITINDSDDQLRPGMSATLRFPAKHSIASCLIPINYLSENADGTYLVLKANGNTVQQCTIEGAKKGTQFIALKKGLDIGDKLLPWVKHD